MYSVKPVELHTPPHLLFPQLACQAALARRRPQYAPPRVERVRTPRRVRGSHKAVPPPLPLHISVCSLSQTIVDHRGPSRFPLVAAAGGVFSGRRSGPAFCRNRLSRRTAVVNDRVRRSSLSKLLLGRFQRTTSRLDAVGCVPSRSPAAPLRSCSGYRCM